MTHPTPIPEIGTPRAAWRLLAPFWFSRDNWYAWPLAVGMVVLVSLVTFVQVQSARWTNLFMTTLLNRDMAGFPRAIALFLAIGVAMAVVSILNRALQQALEIVWRTWMTRRSLTHWLRDNSFYAIERDGLFDNPDQRIAEDIQLFISSSILLSVGLYGTLTQIVTFSYLMWTGAGALDLPIGGGISIPGYMFWCALLWVAIQSGFGHWAGRALMPLNFVKQKVEGDFRYSMASVRRSAEEIAIYGGFATELRRLNGYFMAVRDNLWQLLFVQIRFQAVMGFLEQMMTPLPLILMAPQYFSRKMEFGQVAQTGQLFGQLTNALLWFIRNYEVLQIYRVVVARLYAFEQLHRVRGGVGSGFDYGRTSEDRVVARDLTLRTPTGRTLVTSISVDIEPGQRWLIRGRSGSGKSTFLRTLAGIWPYGTGAVSFPASSTCLFMSQRAYLPFGTLKAALCFPHLGDAFSDDECGHALRLAGLSPFEGSLDVVDRWSDRLSQGEQQRLALARALVQRPDFLFMDEATSALDGETEAEIYRNLVETLSGSAIVHVAHHASLSKFHDHTLVFGSTGVTIAGPDSRGPQR